MVKIAVLGIVIVLCALPFKSLKSEYSVLISLSGSLLIFWLAIGKLRELIDFVNTLTGYIPINRSYIIILLKMLGITYITEFSADLCKDAGYGAVASQISLVGKLTMLGISIPVLTVLLESISLLWER